MFRPAEFNIDSLVVGEPRNPELSRMTIVVNADDNTLGAGAQTTCKNWSRWSRFAIF